MSDKRVPIFTCGHAQHLFTLIQTDLSDAYVQYAVTVAKEHLQFRGMDAPFRVFPAEYFINKPFVTALIIATVNPVVWLPDVLDKITTDEVICVLHDTEPTSEESIKYLTDDPNARWPTLFVIRSGQDVNVVFNNIMTILTTRGDRW